MRALPAWSKDPLLVFAISFHDTRFHEAPKSENLTLPVVDGDVLEEVKYGQCQVVEPTITDFALMPDAFSPGLALMWRPLAEAGIWAALRDHEPAAIEQFAKPRQAFRLDGATAH